jgi:hypothetical protein
VFDNCIMFDYDISTTVRPLFIFHGGRLPDFALGWVGHDTVNETLV